MSAFFADHARLADGWRRNVLLEWNDDGTLVRRQRPTARRPRASQRAEGPVIAGMPNLHSHAFQRAMAGLTEYRASATDTFWSWRDLMYRFAARIGPESLAAIARWLYIEMLKAGYTSVCEFHYVHHAQRRHALRESRGTGAARRRCGGARGHRHHDAAGAVPVQRLQQERAARRSAALSQHARTLLDLLDDAASRAARKRHASLWRRAAFAARGVGRIACGAARRARCALSTARRCISISRSRPPKSMRASPRTGQRPVQWLLDRFAVDERWCLVHATHVDANECARLAAKRRGRRACVSRPKPISATASFRRAIISMRADASASARTAISAWTGARNCGCSNTASVCARQQRNVLASPTQSRPADRLFDASLDGGAHASGRAIGALAQGKRADWLVLDAKRIRASRAMTRETWLSSAVFCEHGDTPIRDVFVGGRKVIDARRHAQEDEALRALSRRAGRTLR